MDYQTRKTAELIPYANNAKKHSDEQIKKISASIKEFGFINPVIIDSENGIIAGHGRVMAAEKLKLTEVPVLLVEHLTEAQKKAYILADNRLAEIGTEWDMELVKIELDSLDVLGFDVGLTGFDVDFMGLPCEYDEDADGEIAEPPDDPVTKLGDIWVMGRHRLMCGDSTSIDAVDELMPEVANMVFTDPSYLMGFTGCMHGDGTKSFNAKHGSIKNDKMSVQEGDDFLDAINATIRAKVDGAFYITFYRLGIDRYFASLKRTGLQCRSLIIWDKGNHTLSNSDYMSMYEPMFYGWVNSHKFYGGKNGMDIWRIARTKKNDLHPTMKPLELVEKAINDGSQVNGVVLDLFGGSGTTLIAAEKNNRIARIMELDPKCCDVIVNRWQTMTGKNAVLESTGAVFGGVAP